MDFFNIDFDNLVWTNLPIRLRQPIQFAWLKALAAPVKYVYNLFMTNRANSLYLLGHNSQVCYIEATLNDTFDTSLRRIYITDGSAMAPVNLYLVTEADPVWLGKVSEEGTTSYLDPVPLYTESETIVRIGFIVNVPASITFDMARMKALVDLYRLPGRNVYSIVTF